jgi:hypothetical protein
MSTAARSRAMTPRAYDCVFTVTALGIPCNHVLPLPPVPGELARPLPPAGGDRCLAVLIGGDGAGYQYSAEPTGARWGVRSTELARRHDARLLLTTSRRTGAAAENLLHASDSAGAAWPTRCGGHRSPRPVMRDFLAAASGDRGDRGQPERWLPKASIPGARWLGASRHGPGPMPMTKARCKPTPSAACSSAAASMACACRCRRGTAAIPDVRRRSPPWCFPCWKGRPMKNILFWGRYGNYGPDYPRNRVIESVLRDLGCQVQRFLPGVVARWPIWNTCCAAAAAPTWSGCPVSASATLPPPPATPAAIRCHWCLIR